MNDGDGSGRTPRLPVARSIVCGGLLAFIALAPTACGGGVALLHPAQTLGQGRVRAATGFSANVAIGEIANAIGDARAQRSATARPTGAMGVVEADARAALVAASIGPGLAPFVAARVGLGRSFEGGLTYTGRIARADVRRSFDWSRHWALSVGAAGSAALTSRQVDEVAPSGVDLSALHGWGVDVPIVLGYASDGDLYILWIGGRGGWEHVEVSDLRTMPGTASVGPPLVSLSATHLWGGGLVGLAVGFRHVHVAMEMDASYGSVTGDYAGVHARLGALTLAPATAVWWTF